MEAWDAICARRNVREYQPRAIAGEDLDRIVEAGWRAPSAKNRQPWDFVIVTDRTQLQELSTVWRGAGHIAGAPAAIAIVVPEPPDERRLVTDNYDVGQATMAMMIAATDLGIGAGHSSVGDQDKARHPRRARRSSGGVPTRGGLSRRSPAHPDPQAEPPAVHRGRAPRPLVSAQPKNVRRLVES